MKPKLFTSATGLVLLSAALFAPNARAQQQQYPPGTIIMPGNGAPVQTVPQQGNRNGGGYGGYGGRRRNRGNNGNGNQNGNNNGNNTANGANGNQNQNRNGRQNGPALPNFEFVAGGVINSAPTVSSGDMVYVGSWNNKVYALDAKTGQAKWNFTAGRLFNASPAVGKDGTIYVNSYDHNVYALDGKTGAKKWQFTTGDVLNTVPAVGSTGLVYVGSQDHTLYALDPATGKPKWQLKTGAAVSSPIVGPDNTVYVGADGVYALDGTTGAKKWVFPTISDPEPPLALGPDGTLYAATHGGTLFALDGATGARKWKADFPDEIEAAPAVAGDRVYVGADKLYALRASDGHPLWQYAGGSTSGGWSTPAVAPNGTLYVGNDDKTVYSLKAATGSLNWAFKTNDPLVTFPRIGSDGALYLAAQGEQKVYALNARTGQTLWQFTQDPVPTPPRTAIPATIVNGGTNNGGYGNNGGRNNGGGYGNNGGYGGNGGNNGYGGGRRRRRGGG